ncbi:pickpocket protein 28-like [Fopius arisanus]|uniref:Pickpocket protein 28-like n=1 Tax=Fopius arisanus TaxID=64838 RepID=A0A9R1U6X5_9HYME|nr:PREDICTED: pickpocket protein 28-like [Fopius arisanus]
MDYGICRFYRGERTPKEVTAEVSFQFPKDKYIHEQVFGFIDFLAAVGGAAGLVLGASILSFVEIFYFATLRCFLYYRKMQREKRRYERMKQRY